VPRQEIVCALENVPAACLPYVAPAEIGFWSYLPLEWVRPADSIRDECPLARGWSGTGAPPRGPGCYGDPGLGDPLALV